MTIMLPDQERQLYAPNKSDGEVLAAAKLSFCKATRTLYRYIFPNSSKRDLEKKVLAAWDSSSVTEKQCYMLKVRGASTARCCPTMINPRLIEVLSPSFAKPEPEKPHKISLSCDNNAEAQPAAVAVLPSGKGANKRSHSSAPEQGKKCSKKQKRAPGAEAQPAAVAVLPSGKGANKRSHSSAPEQGKKCSKKQKRAPSAEEGENSLLGGFPADEINENAFISKCIQEEESKLEFEDDPEWINQLKKFLSETPGVESLFEVDSNGDKISFSSDNRAETQPTTEAALPSGNGSNKKSCSSAPEQGKKCSKKQKWGPTVQKGGHALLGGFCADKMDKDAFISKCMLKDESKLEFDCSPKSISQLETLPFETKSLLKDDSTDDKITFSCDNNAEAQPAAEAVLPSGKGANKRSHSSAPEQGRKCSKKQKWAPTVQKGEHALLGGFCADKMDKDAFISKCMLKDESKLEFDCSPKSISQLEMLPFETKSLLKDDSTDDEITFSCDNNAEAQPAAEAVLPSGKGANKRSHSSAPEQGRKCTKKQKRAPTVQKGEHALLGGFCADKMDKDAFISKCMLKDESKLEFDCNPKSSQLETLPFETESLLKDDSTDDKITFSCDNNAEAQPAAEAVLPSGKGANKRSHSSAPEQGKKCSKKQKWAPTVQKGEHALLGGFCADKMDKDAFISKCMLKDESKLEFDCNPKSSQLETLPFETESLLKDDSTDDKITFSCDNNAEAQPAAEAVLPSGKGANKRSHSSAPEQGKKCSKKQKWAPTVQKGEHALLGGFCADKMDKDAFISKCMLKDESKLEFDCNPKSSQLETLPFETESILKDDSKDDKISFSCDVSAKAQPTTEAALPSGNGSNKKSRSSAQKQAKKSSRKQKQAPTVQKGVNALIGGFAADELDEDASTLKWMVEDELKLEYSWNHISVSQFEKCPSETESLFKDDSNNDWWARIPTLDDLLHDM